ncbi:DUF3570 domain-containing protein [Chitinophaga agri]|uniref:DUF3570 domain-containing protein n=1 Tax=Chitinophaga agri TaxID=2703787 RepID=A0A6B9ZBB9_9BACT|nr:DUF3570 domain-containing protein [Chitinophaga agri]QHS59129.1 DUF3570 domain-containing protein [Chitinophaga agri]
MKKLNLAILAMFAGILYTHAQSAPDSSTYRNRKLQLEEVNIVSSYYHQNGDHAAVTGGTGTQLLTDLSNSIQVTLSKYDVRDRKHTLNFELGIDHYTSASSDNIDPKTLSSASSADTRFYPSLSWEMENKNGTTVGAGLSFSHEFDYQSVGANIMFAKKTRNKMGEFALKLQTYQDQLKLIYPIELRSSGGNGNREEDDYATTGRKTYSSSLSWSQIVNSRLQLMFLVDVIYQSGYLGLPFHRVYFNDNSVHVEKLPDSRLKIPLGIRANYFLGDRVVLRGYYRYYHDNWQINAHTASLETSIKLSPFYSFTPFYRYNHQQGTKYFAPYQVHTGAGEYYTSNYDLSGFDSHFFGAGIRLTPPKGVLGMKHFNMLELRYGHYNQSNGLQANSISLNLKFK